MHEMDLRSGCAIELVLCISMPMWKKGQLDYYMKKNVRCSHGYFYALFAVPTMIYILLFKFIPFAGNIIAFLDYKLLKGIWESEWIGLQHFVRLFQSDIFWNALDNTLHLNLLDLLIGFPFTIILSLALALMRGSLRELDLAPDQIWFCGDDAYADIEGAVSVGMRGVLYRKFAKADQLGPVLLPSEAVEIYRIESLLEMLK